MRTSYTAVFLTLCVACGAGGGTGGPDGGKTDAGGQTPDGGQTGDGGQTPDGGQTTDGGGTTCTALIDLSNSVHPTFQSASAPPAVGGAIVDGTYVLTTATQYGGVIPPQTFHGTHRFTAGTVEHADNYGVWKATYVTSASSLTENYICSTAINLQPYTHDYAATATSYTDYEPQGSGTLLLSYTKQ